VKTNKGFHSWDLFLNVNERYAAIEEKVGSTDFYKSLTHDSNIVT
jgi:hypothetical protein